jgi:hypothetical protein
MTEFERVGVPLEPGRDGRIAPWNSEHAAVMGACAEAWVALLKQRRVFEVAVSEASHPETWPHA